MSIRVIVHDTVTLLTRRDFVISGKHVYFWAYLSRYRVNIEVNYSLQTFSQHILDRYREKDEDA